MPIKDTATFAEECVRQGLFLGVNPHYLLAAAMLRSGIKDDVDDSRVGPYRVTQALWDANGSASDLEVVLDSVDIEDWRLQVLFAALTAFRAQNTLLDRLGRFPSALELYQEQWADNSVDLSTKLQKALDDTAALVDPAATKVLDAAPANSPKITDPDKPASPTAPDLSKPTPAKGEALFLVKAPRIMEKLIHDFDLKDFQAAGILGNIGLECDGFRLMQEVHPIGGGRGGFGWCQWTGDRRNKFEAFCSAQGLDPTADAANYGYLKRELQTTEKASIDAVKGTTTLVQAVHVFEAAFERAKAGLEHFDRRERWGQLASANFQIQLPAAVAKMLDPDLIYNVAATAISGMTNFWVVEQFTENGGQVLISQTAGQEPRILAQDTTVIPVRAELIPDPVPAAVANALSANFKPSGDLHPDIPSVQNAASDQDAAQRVFAKAKECDDTLVTRNVPNTNQGHLACAFAVNEVVRQALGKPIGGGLSTSELAKVLRANHTAVGEGTAAAGMVIISPTQGSNVGHVGIVGKIGTPVSGTAIYSNSSNRGVFSHAFTMGAWKNFYGSRKGLPVSFFALQAKNLGK